MPVSNTYSPSAPTGRTGQGSGVANREDLDSQLTLLAATTFPITMLCGRGTAKSTLCEWPVDKLSTPVTTGVEEGADATSFTDQFAEVARLQNRVQAFRETWRVSKEQELSESAGPQDKARAKVKAMLQLKRNIEATIASDNDSTAQSSGVAATLRGLGKWINTSPGTDVPGDYRTPATSIISAAPTEITFNDILKSIFSVNGEVNNLTAVCGTDVRQEIAEFQRTDNNASETVYRVNTNAEDKKVTLAVNIYESDFGFVRIINGNPACMPSAKRAYILNPSYIKLKVLQPAGSVELEDQGGGPRGYVDTRLTLAVSDPRAHGKIAYT